MKWWVLILLPFHLLAQETYTDCENIQPQNYQVEYDANKVYYWSVSSGQIISDVGNSITVQWPDSLGTFIITVYTTRFGCEGDTSKYEVVIEDCPYLQMFIPNSFTPNQDNHNETFYVWGRW